MGRARAAWQWALTLGIWLVGAAAGALLWRWVKQGPLVLEAAAAVAAFFYVLALLPIHELVKVLASRAERNRG